MSIYQNTGPSAAMLAEYLRVDLIMPYDNHDLEKRYHQPCERGKQLPVAINYGCSKKHLTPEMINYNSWNVRDKVFCFKVFDSIGIKHPKLIDNPAEYNKFFLGRKNRSSQGKGMVKFRPKSPNWNKRGSDFWVEFIKGKAEYRVHVWGDDILIELNKDFSKNEHKFIRNWANGSSLKYGNIDHPKRLDILSACIQATKSCGLTFGAVDIIVDQNDDWYFLEINSAPRLSKLYAMIYAQHIDKIYDLKTKFLRYIDWPAKTSRLLRDKHKFQ